ncbi:MAG TPA: amidohydrolase family protein [Candidatus Limnocylindrales bacterium]
MTLADGAVADVIVASGTIAYVGPSLPPTHLDEVRGVPTLDLRGFVLLPSFVEPHAHLDKAYTADLVANPRGDLGGAIDAWIGARSGFSGADVQGRAEKAALNLVAGGATAIRSHADTGPDIGLRSVEALLDVRARLAGVADLQVVACGALPLSGSDGAANRATLEAALDAGADAIGGAPWLDPDPDSAIAYLVGLGRERNLPLDLHLDETLDPRSLSIEILLRHVGPGPLPAGRITASHVVSLGAQAEADQVRIARAIAAAGVGVVALPRSNLYLQGRGLGTSTPRGITALGALLSAGAVVAGGGDNLRDPFTPIGRPDVLETASLLVSAGHLSPEQALSAVTVSARCVMGLPPVAVRGGSPADLVAIRATSVVDAVGGAHSERLVFKSGRLVAHTRVVSEVAL